MFLLLRTSSPWPVCTSEDLTRRTFLLVPDDNRHPGKLGACSSIHIPRAGVVGHECNTYSYNPWALGGDGGKGGFCGRVHGSRAGHAGLIEAARLPLNFYNYAELSIRFRGISWMDSNGSHGCGRRAEHANTRITMRLGYGLLASRRVVHKYGMYVVVR